MKRYHNSKSFLSRMPIPGGRVARQCVLCPFALTLAYHALSIFPVLCPPPCPCQGLKMHLFRLGRQGDPHQRLHGQVGEPGGIQPGRGRRRGHRNRLPTGEQKLNKRLAPVFKFSFLSVHRHCVRLPSGQNHQERVRDCLSHGRRGIFVQLYCYYDQTEN